jgi:ribosomal protein L37AE/L43A
MMNFFKKLFCKHIWKKTDTYGKVDIWTCEKCYKKYYQDNPWDSPPIDHIY